MNKIRKFLKEEFINGSTAFDWIFLSIGLLLQVIAIVLSATIPAMHDDYLAITAISGITGCFCVLFSSRGKISNYAFGYIQLFTYLFGVAFPLALWGEVFENIIYAVTMVFGIIIWIKRYKKNNLTEEIAVNPKHITALGWILTTVLSIASIVGFAFLLPQLSVWFPKLFATEDPFPILDSITTIVPLIGEILMCIGYKEQWIFWLIEDVMSLVMFILIGNWVMVAQYIFWTANCIYGWVKWRQLELINKEN